MQPEKARVYADIAHWVAFLDSLVRSLAPGTCSAFFAALAVTSVLRRKQLLCGQNPNRLLLKGNQNLPQASACLLVSVPCSQCCVSSGSLWGQRRGRSNISLRGCPSRQLSSCCCESCVSLCCHLQSSGNERKSTRNSVVRWAYVKFGRSTYIFLALSLLFFFSCPFEPL